ncbi:hypothetical protein ACFW9I_32580 [[Kitasatospora] papulosa]|uniref:hypothetical protein n=1 Tax=[Kitasatospora] papulosa TaxID=1464011 RepID=UPI003699D156
MAIGGTSAAQDWVALAVTAEGRRDILGPWAGDGGAGAKQMMRELNRATDAVREMLALNFYQCHQGEAILTALKHLTTYYEPDNGDRRAGSPIFFSERCEGCSKRREPTYLRYFLPCCGLESV